MNQPVDFALSLAALRLAEKALEVAAERASYQRTLWRAEQLLRSISATCGEADRARALTFADELHEIVATESAGLAANQLCAPVVLSDFAQNLDAIRECFNKIPFEKINSASAGQS